MANKFQKKEWVDRQSQYPSRRKLTSTSIENVYEVERAEGDVTEPGNAFDAANMNDIEDRIYSAFGTLDATDILVHDALNHFTATALDGVLDELFMYASNGKSLFANAIGGSPSSSFQTLANLAKSIKDDRDSGKTLIANAIGGSPSSSFKELANLISGRVQRYIGNLSKYTISTYSGRLYQEVVIPINFGFVPNYVFINNVYADTGKTGSSYTVVSISNTGNHRIEAGTEYGIKNIKSNSITLWIETKSDFADIVDFPVIRTSYYNTSYVYAFG